MKSNFTKFPCPMLAVVGFSLILFVMMLNQVQGSCTTSVCSAACNLMTLNNNSLGQCSSTYTNPNFGNDPSCICDACPPASIRDIVNVLNVNGTCMGAPAQTTCTSCPTSNPATCTYIPHVCTLTDPATSVKEQLCVCMAGNAIQTVCPFLPLPPLGK